MRQGLSTIVGKRLRGLALACAFGALLSPAVVQSLSLGEIRVRSHLGEPLEAVVPVDGVPHETLDAACVSVGEPDNGLPGIERVHASFDPAGGQLVLRSASPVREPLSEITVRVRCAGAPALERSVLVVLDLPDVRAQSVFARRGDEPPARPASPSARDDTVARSPSADAATAGRTSETTTRAAESPATHTPAPVEPPSQPRAPRQPAIAPAAALDSESADAGPAPHAGLTSVPPVALAPRESNATPVLHRFVLSTTFSGASMAKFEARRRGIARAAEAAAARPAAPVSKPETVQAVEPPDAVAAAAIADSSARSEPAGEAHAAQPDAASTGISHSSWLRWIVSVLGAVVLGAVLGGIGVRIVIWRRQAAELHRRQSMRRASGLERSIRLDHGIIVKEHPAGTPLTVDASTQELAAMRMVEQRAVAPTPAAAPVDDAPTVRSSAAPLYFATEAADEVTLQIGSPLTDLDLLLPEMPDLPLLPDASEVPTDIVAAAPQGEPRVDSRQFALDTDLMELAYRDETANAEEEIAPEPRARVAGKA